MEKPWKWLFFVQNKLLRLLGCVCGLKHFYKYPKVASQLTTKAAYRYLTVGLPRSFHKFNITTLGYLHLKYPVVWAKDTADISKLIMQLLFLSK